MSTRPPLWRELLLGLAAFALYVVAGHVDTSPGRAAAAQRNGYDLLHIERVLGIPAEEWFNAWLAPHQVLRVIANYEYAITYIASALWLLGWLYLRRPDMYRYARTSFLIMNVLAIATFYLYPVAPPRLLVGAGFVDTVRDDGTWASWGSPIVSQANQLAAMPSLHIGWALWVSVFLAYLSSARWVQAASALHVTATLVVILATANHYLLDAVAGAVLVWVSLALLSLVQDRPGIPPRVAPADAFFLYAESPAAPQTCGGMMVLDDCGNPGTFRDRLEAAVRAHLDEISRYQVRLSPPGVWRRHRWLPVTDLDWRWHVPAYDVAGPGGRPGGRQALDDLVAEIQETPLPRDRPLWRIVAVTGFAPGKVAAIFVMHHVVADGFALLAQVMALLEPAPPGLPAGGPGIPLVRRVAGVTKGLVQLAGDGPNRYRLPTSTGAPRRYATLPVSLPRMREVAREHGVRFIDLLLSVVAGAVGRVLDGRPVPPTLRTTVPLTARLAGSTADGNGTAAVLVDVPLGERVELARLAETHRSSERLRTGTRAMGSHFVMSTGCALLPPPVLAWFARTVYGQRFFQAIVSNIPGPVGAYRLAGAVVEQVYPVLALAPAAPLAVGALTWDGTLYFGISLDPALVGEGDKFVAALRDTLAELKVAPLGDSTRTDDQPLCP